MSSYNPSSIPVISKSLELPSDESGQNNAEASKPSLDVRRKYLASLGIGNPQNRAGDGEGDLVVPASAPAALSPLAERLRAGSVTFGRDGAVVLAREIQASSSTPTMSAAAAAKRRQSEASTTAVNIPSTHGAHNAHNAHVIPPRNAPDHFHSHNMPPSFEEPRVRRNTMSHHQPFMFPGASDDDSSDSETDHSFGRGKRFIPPHELMARSKEQFNVGTAHSVAVWERNQRRLNAF